MGKSVCSCAEDNHPSNDLSKVPNRKLGPMLSG